MTPDERAQEVIDSCVHVGQVVMRGNAAVSAAECGPCLKCIANAIEVHAAEAQKSDANYIVAEFTELLYGRALWDHGRSRWRGVPIAKNPLDLFVLQEILWDCQPDMVIETGTWFGGSALFIAETLEAIGHGGIYTIDSTAEPIRPKHARIVYIQADVLNEDLLQEIMEYRKPRTMVILDDDHEKEHVLAELAAYGKLVTPGQHLIVEDTNTSGPREAVASFMQDTVDFEVDLSREKFGCTFNPGGYLRRIK